MSLGTFCQFSVIVGHELHFSAFRNRLSASCPGFYDFPGFSLALLSPFFKVKASRFVTSSAEHKVLVPMFLRFKYALFYQSEEAGSKPVPGTSFKIAIGEADSIPTSN